jgi:hypothetical protein
MTRHVVIELAFDVVEQGAGADAEEVWLQPAVAQLLLHQKQPVKRVFGGPQTTGGFEADLMACEGAAA